MHWILSNHYGACVCVLIDQLLNDKSAILFRFSPNFTRGWEMWSVQRLLFMRQNGKRFMIFEVCKIRFLQFLDCCCHVFPWTVSKTRTEYKLMSTDFVLDGHRNRK